ncbi:O-antigen ligase [Sphingorhabdus rigui]|uniref:O-antigen ligase n=1 Tax=Sphingorhabdus rigui TaxID=1282858 RepID=A0A840AZK7_9SPHN|nr:O-antigen ligase family protein [Sphingorhabdus rigui]MBB3941784.1 O-antigen ligase [Sphingorhabdus rigui]
MHNDSFRTRMGVAAILVGLLPAWMVLAPLDITRAPEVWQLVVRVNAFAVPMIQLIFILLAMGGSFSPIHAVRELPFISKFALALWFVIASVVSFQPGKEHFFPSVGISKLMVAGLFFLALIHSLRMVGNRLTHALWLSIGAGTLIWTLLWVTHIFLYSPQGDEWVYRIPGVDNVRHMGHFAVAGVTAGLVGVIVFRDRTNMWLRWVLPVSVGAVSFGLSLWTGSRGPLLASLVVVAATLCLAAGHRKSIAKFFAASALLSTAVVATLPLPHHIYGIAEATGMADVTANADHDASSGRTLLWSGTIEKISERPIFGWGINQFFNSGPSKPANFFHPHNFPLQLMFSGGIVSVLLTLLIVIPILLRWRWPYTKGESAAGVGAVVGLLVYSLYDGALYFSYPTTIFLVAIATSVAPAEVQHGNDR